MRDCICFKKKMWQCSLTHTSENWQLYECRSWELASNRILFYGANFLTQINKQYGTFNKQPIGWIQNWSATTNRVQTTDKDPIYIYACIRLSKIW